MAHLLLTGFAAILAVAAAIACYALGRRANRRAESTPHERTHGRASRDGLQTNLRGYALDAIGESVLLVHPDGRVLDCNSAALTLFQRHRDGLCDVYASTIRTFGKSGAPAYEIAQRRGLWTGESWIRLPDGSVTLCLSRVVPIYEPGSEEVIVAFAEAHRDVVAEQVAGRELRDRLYSATAAAGSVAADGREALAKLGAAFRDLETSMQAYDRILSALSVQDPVTEVLAGLVHEVRETNLALGTQATMHDVPVLLAKIGNDLDRRAAPRPRTIPS